MRLLLDQGLPRSSVAVLQSGGHDVVHVGDIGMARATDEQILERAVADARVVVTLDADFHMLLALAKATKPSVLRLRIEGLDGGGVARVIEAALTVVGPDLDAGAVATVDETRARVRRLPLL